MADVAVVGAGLSGAVVARELAEQGWRVDVFEERNHVAGTCHSARDPDSGVVVHVHGPHIFHTHDPAIWAWANRFAPFRPIEHRVRAVTRAGVFSLPINLLTINQFFSRCLSPAQARAFVAGRAVRLAAPPRNFEEKALMSLGPELYETFFRGYTEKHWGISPGALPASVFARLPVRFNYDDRYFDDAWQGIPVDGYTDWIARILDHPAIHLQLLRRFNRADASSYAKVFYSGPIDRWFDDCAGRLPYRALRFEAEWGEGDLQGCAVMNYCDAGVPWTRACEPAHFTPWEKHERSVLIREFSVACGPDDVPCYPLPTAGADDEILVRYRALAAEERRVNNVTFLGRLGTYRYLNMDVVIEEARRVAAAALSPTPSRGPHCAPSSSPLLHIEEFPKP